MLLLQAFIRDRANCQPNSLSNKQYILKDADVDKEDTKKDPGILLPE